MDKSNLVENFKKRRYKVSYFDNYVDALDYLDKEIDNEEVGFGDSMTLLKMGLYDRLLTHNKVVDPQHQTDGKTFNEVAKECLVTDIFITSVNAATINGELVNIDGTGNRVAGSLFGHKKVYFVLGTNKIMPNLDEAINRAKNIAAPLNAKRLNKKTPCAIKGDKCYDCSSPERICNATIVHHKKMSNIEMEIIIINEELGL